jgi:hypothetical protein
MTMALGGAAGVLICAIFLIEKAASAFHALAASGLAR